MEENDNPEIDANTKIKIRAALNSLRFYGTTTVYYNRLNIADVIPATQREFKVLNPNASATDYYQVYNNINTWILDHFAIRSTYEDFKQTQLDATQEQTITLTAKPDSPFFYGSVVVDLKLIDISKMRDLQLAIEEAVLAGLEQENNL